MPLIKIQTSAPRPDSAAIEALLASLSAELAQQLGKPEAYVMTCFESDAAMTFAGTFAPTCYVEIKSVGTLSANQTKAMSQIFCQAIQDHLDVPASRTYIEFADAKGYLWGWNSRTF